MHVWVCACVYVSKEKDRDGGEHNEIATVHV